MVSRCLLTPALFQRYERNSALSHVDLTVCLQFTQSLLAFSLSGKHCFQKVVCVYSVQLFTKLDTLTCDFVRTVLSSMPEINSIYHAYNFVHNKLTSDAQ